MLSPWNLGRIGFRVESDLLTIDEHSVFPQFNMMRESEMCGVIGEEILEVFGIHEGIIDHCHIDPSWDFEGGSEDESADTAKSIDSKHFKNSLIKDSIDLNLSFAFYSIYYTTYRK